MPRLPLIYYIIGAWLVVGALVYALCVVLRCVLSLLT